MQILQSMYLLLNKKSTTVFLLSFILLITLGLFANNLFTISGDHYTYLSYINGMRNGRYSYWYFLKDYIPDTFRNPGYPLFLYVFSYVYDSLYFIKFIQLLLLGFTFYYMLKIIEHYSKERFVKNLFLVFVLINFIVLSYPPFIYPESLMMFLMTVIVYIELTMEDNSWKKILVLVVLYAFTFQVRPVIIFLPFIRFAYYVVKRQQLSVLKNFAFLLIFILSLLPYGYWNFQHHHQFKITPIEGGAGAMYLGYWSPKMIDHVEDRYWRNVMNKDVFVNFADEKDVPGNIRAFNNEWDSVDRICSKYLTAQDSQNIAEMKKYPDLFIIHNTQYTTERENILNKLAVHHYLQDFSYTMKLKTFTFFRLWYSGLFIKEVQVVNLRSITIVAAFAGSFLTLLLFICYFIYCLFRRRDILRTLALPLLLCLYFDIFHVPFVIQARYTIPVRLLYLFCLSFMIYKINFQKKDAAINHAAANKWTHEL